MAQKTPGAQGRGDIRKRRLCPEFLTHETQKAVLQANCLQDRFFVLFLKISGRNCLHREGVPFDADARRNAEGAAGATTMRPLRFADRPAGCGPDLAPFSRKAGKPRHPLWLSRRFDDAAAQKGLLPGVVFLRNPGKGAGGFSQRRSNVPFSASTVMVSPGAGSSARMCRATSVSTFC